MIALLLTGAFFRFHHLDRKIYWNDEVWTSLWLSGYRGGEVVDRVFDGRELAAARIVNRAAHPLLISDASGPNPRNVISLGYRLAPHVRIRLLDDRRPLVIPDLDGDVFLFNPSPQTRRAIEAAGYRIEETHRKRGLSRLVR